MVLMTSLRMATQNAITKLVIKKSLPIISEAAILIEVFLVILLPSMDYFNAVKTGLFLFKMVFLCVYICLVLIEDKIQSSVLYSLLCIIHFFFFYS